MKALFYSTFSIIVVFILGGGGYRLAAQDPGNIQPDSIRAEVIKLLEKYEFCHNSLNDTDENMAERNFVRLFSNPKIQIIQDFIGYSASGMMSVQDYTSTLIDNFPDGVTVKLSYNGMVIGNPRFDRDDRYLVRVRINQSKSAVYKGKVLTCDEKVVFLVAFRWDGEGTSDFAIHGIILPPQKSDFAGIAGKAGFSGILNSKISEDTRFAMVPSVSYAGGLQYLHQFDKRWGILTGIHYQVLNSSLTLDEFDPVGGFTVPFTDITFNNRFWLVQVPVEGVCRFDLGKKLSLVAGAGISAGARIFESQEVSALNELSGTRIRNVISDPDWYNFMNRYELEVITEAGFVYWIQEGAGLTAGLSYSRGITSLDHLVRVDAESSKYQGQSNPLWANDTGTFPWRASFNLGCWISINGNQK